MDQPKDHKISSGGGSPARARSRRAVIDLLKQEGPMEAAELAARLGLSAMAVRQHLYGLRDERLVAYQTEARPIGRPAKLWHLTEAADRFFPDGHGELTLDLIGAITEAFGEAGLERLLEVRARSQVAAYGKRVRPSQSLPKRLAALAELRSAEGYMAAARKDPNGGYLLVENHCPICSAAAKCQGLCASELAVFRQVLGPDVEVERTDHILAGARRCAYRVRRREG